MLQFVSNFREHKTTYGCLFPRSNLVGWSKYIYTSYVLYVLA